jgi:hypothetical protein
MEMGQQQQQQQVEQKIKQQRALQQTPLLPLLAAA